MFGNRDIYGTRSRAARLRGAAIVLVCAAVAIALVAASMYISSSWARDVAAGLGSEIITQNGSAAKHESSGYRNSDDTEAEGTASPQGRAGSSKPQAGNNGDGAQAGSLASPSAGTTAPAISAPAVKSIKLDAKELLFGKKGRKLTLKVTVTPAVQGGTVDMGGIKFKSSDKGVATVNSKGVVKAKGWGTCKITARLGGKKAKCKVTVAKKWVALTFDDGPGPYTEELVKNMKKRGVRATFFVVGQMAKSRTAVLKKAFKNGNEIGNHTYAHNGSAGALMGGLKDTDKIVKKATGKKTALMRPPGGAINGVTRSCGKPIIMWTVDPKDWQDRNANTVYSRVMANTRSGSIVLLHDIHPTTVTAAYRIMDELKSRGYAFVTVSELLNKPKANLSYNSGPKKVRTMKIKY